MKELAITTIENEQIKDLFTLFFGVIQDSLEIKDKQRSRFSQITSDRNLRSLVENQEILKFKTFDSFIKNLQALEKNQAYLETTDWKVLGFLSPSLINSQNPAAVYETLDYLNLSEFLSENNFSVIKVASIIYSLSQSEPLDAAKMLIKLDHFDLLNEESLGKIRSNRKLDIKLHTSVIEKLSLSGGTDHLLTKANLDKLLENPELNLEILAKFIQAEDKSKILTQEKFDLAINLKNLLTLENIEKIEKAAFDPKKLADVISLLDAANILTQDNFDQFIGLNKDDFEKIVPVLDTMHGKKILNQDNLLKFLNTFLNLSIYDAEQHQNNGSSSEQPSSSTLADQLCSSLVGLLSRIGKFFQEFFDDILNYFNDKTENNAENITTDNQAIDTNSRVNSRASFFGNSSSRKDIDNNEDLSPRLVSSH